MSPNGFGATWDTAPGATGYQIQVSINDDFSSILTTYTSIGNVNGFIPGGNLTPGNTYFFRIKACSSVSNCSQWSPSVSLYIPPPPSFPLNFSVNPTTNASGFIAMWDTVNNTPTYKIGVSMSDNFIPSSIHTTSNTNFTLSNLLHSDNTYFFRIQSCITANNCSAFSPSVSMYMEPLIDKPTNLTAAVNQNTGLVNLSWQDNSNNETGFSIRYCKQQFTLDYLGWYNCPLGQGGYLFHTLNSMPYAFVPGVLDSGTTYYFIVRSYISNNGNYSYSGHSNIASVTTP